LGCTTAWFPLAPSAIRNACLRRIFDAFDAHGGQNAMLTDDAVWIYSTLAEEQI
jgi:hypothetical protein